MYIYLNMSKFLIRIIILFSFVSFINCHASSCTTVMDAESGRTLYSYNDNTKYLIASTTKIMTALVTINNTDLNKKIKVGDEVIDAYGSAIYINPGEYLTIKDLLYGLMLRSGNDAALTLAKNVGGSTEGMAKLMNETAKSIGMMNTKFYNPHGLDEETQNKSTCYDMALLLREAMKKKEFRKITRTREYKLKTNFNTYHWTNKNKLLKNYKYAIGGKIGYTKRAGHTFISVSQKNNKRIIISSFKDDNMYENHKELYEKYFKKYQLVTLIDKNNLRINYDKKYKIYTLSSFKALLSDNEKNKVKREILLYKNITNGKIGIIKIKLNGKILVEKGLYAIKK